MSPRLFRRGLSAFASSALGLAMVLALVPAPTHAAPVGPRQALAPTATPDVLDINFANAVATDTAKSIQAITYGTPTFGNDPVQGPTMKVNGVDDAVGFDIAPHWDSLTGGVAIECVFKLNAPMPTSKEMDLCSDKEAGGISVYVNGPNLGFMGHIGGGYKNALTPIESGRWYHTVATWDGTEMRLYVNGQLAATTPATGTLQLPVASARRFVVGGDASPTGMGQPAPPNTEFAGAGLFARAVTDAEVRELAAQWDTRIPVAKADVLDVDFADGTPTERVNDLAIKTFGAPGITQDAALHRNVATFDGDDAYGYKFDPHWSKLTKGASIECVFRYTGTLPTTAENALCSGKESGGLSIYLNGDKAGLMAYIGGAYKTATTQIQANRWYHMLATWDGASIRLYVDGELAATTAASGALGLPAATARAWTVGGDSGPNAGAQFWAQAKIASTRIWSKPLSLPDARALKIAAFGEFPDGGVRLKSSTPTRGATLSEAVELALDVTNSDQASGWRYLLDGAPIALGDKVGPGLAAGKHLIEVTASDVFGKPVKWEIPFESDAIPAGGGTDTGQGQGRVSLSAVASSPDGSDVVTTFRKAKATAATAGFQGVVDALPTTLEFEHRQHTDLAGELMPEDGNLAQSPSSGEIPFQRFDVAVGAPTPGQQVIWEGVVDPARMVSMYAWNATAAAWVELGASRGAAEAETALHGALRPEMIDNGQVRVMVTGTDPFADDLAPRDGRAQDDKDRFEEPESYDFSLAHFTDTQYLAEGAVGGTYDDWDGIDEPSDIQLVEEQAVWAAAYDATTKWIRDNAKERKISYVAHTGDVTENDIRDPLAKDATGKLLYPGLDEQVTKEFDFTSGSQKTMDDAGVVNQVVAGNHDNQMGNEIGPESRWNKWYGPQRYYDAAKTWPAGTSYHAWDETIDASGNVTSPGADNQNNYVLFSAGGLDFVAVGLSYGVTQEEADWASSVFERFPDRNGILLTHAYIKPSTAPDGRGANFSADGSRLYNEVVADNPNVFLILAGHEHGVGTNLKTRVGAKVHHNVVELLADYQFYKVSAGELWPDKVDAAGNIDLNGDGKPDHKKADLLQFGASWLRLLQFDVDRAEMSVDTYSPYFNNFGATEYDDRKRYNGAEDNMRLPVDLNTRTTTFGTDGLVAVTPTEEVIGTQQARSGWPATLTWSGLTEGNLYAWTAETRTTSGERIGSVRQFGTVFRATAAGTDVEAPSLTVPGASTLTVGDAFDPMAGVSARDNTDGDVSNRIQVSGAVDASKAGSYALTYSVADTNGNQTVASRAVVVKVKVDSRPTSVVAVSNTQAVFGQPTTLQANVTPATATGTVQFLNGEEVLCEAPVKGGVAQCSVATLPPPGSYVVTATYGGDAALQHSQKSLVLSVAQPTQALIPTPTVTASPSAAPTPSVAPPSPSTGSMTTPAKADARLVAKAVGKTLVGGRRVRLVAKVAGGVTGSVEFRHRGTVVCRATVADGVARCTVSRRMRPGTYRVVARFGGDATYAAAKDRFTVRVRR